MKNKFGTVLTKEFLIQSYEIAGLEINELVSLVGCSKETIRKYLIHYGITRRPYFESLKRRYRGSGNPNYRGGKTVNMQGYLLLKVPEHPNANNAGYVMEHRVVMEKHLGRYLKSMEVIHHIDGNKKNNKISNLMLFPNRKAHFDFRHFNSKTFICKCCGADQRGGK